MFCHLNVFVTLVRFKFWLDFSQNHLVYLFRVITWVRFLFNSFFIDFDTPSRHTHLLHPHPTPPHPPQPTPYSHLHPRNISSHPSDLKSNHVRHRWRVILPFINLPNIHKCSTRDVNGVRQWLIKYSRWAPEGFISADPEFETLYSINPHFPPPSPRCFQNPISTPTHFMGVYR